MGVNATTLSDWHQYQNLACEMHDLILAGEEDGPRFQHVWERLEELKNQHGGYPPPVPTENKQPN